MSRVREVERFHLTNGMPLPLGAAVSFSMSIAIWLALSWFGWVVLY